MVTGCMPGPVQSPDSAFEVQESQQGETYRGYFFGEMELTELFRLWDDQSNYRMDYLTSL